jgi:hypothetical protein
MRLRIGMSNFIEIGTLVIVAPVGPGWPTRTKILARCRTPHRLKNPARVSARPVRFPSCGTARGVAPLTAATRYGPDVGLPAHYQRRLNCAIKRARQMRLMKSKKKPRLCVALPV